MKEIYYINKLKIWYFLINIQYSYLLLKVFQEFFAIKYIVFSEISYSPMLRKILWQSRMSYKQKRAILIRWFTCNFVERAYVCVVNSILWLDDELLRVVLYKFSFARGKPRARRCFVIFFLVILLSVSDKVEITYKRISATKICVVEIFFFLRILFCFYFCIKKI